LRQLIERFADKKTKLEEGKAEHLDELFPGGRGGEAKEAEVVPRGDVMRYQAEYNSCAMRFKILQNELRDSETELAAQVKRKVAVQRTKSVLAAEKRSVVGKIEALKQELELIETHEREQGEKVTGIERAEKDAIEQIGLIKSTIGNLEGELEKKKMLVLGVGGVVEDEEEKENWDVRGEFK
jgi:uncharacterized protein YhaN